jgi:hypothetical protein
MQRAFGVDHPTGGKSGGFLAADGRSHLQKS